MDLVFVSDDIAGRKSLLLSPLMWQPQLQPRLKRLCDLIHARGLRVFYHTDGAARALIKPILDGGVDNQSILPRGTVDQVRAEVKNCLRTLGAGHEGHICASCHNVQPVRPLENIFTMVETVQQSGNQIS